MQEITGVVLAGGRARRMGGGDKGLLLLHGKPLAQHAVCRLRPQVGRVLVNANRHHDAYAAFADAVVADSVGDYAGPLAGIHAGMSAAQTPWVLTVPCDSPFFPATLAAQLMTAARQVQAQVAVAQAAGRAQPVFMLAQTALAADIAATLAAGEGKIDRWYARLAHTEVPFAQAQDFDNINTPEELQQAAQRLQPAQ